MLHIKTREAFLIVDGRLVSVSFAPEHNETISARLRQMLLSSDGRFADSDTEMYDKLGKADMHLDNHISHTQNALSG